MLLEVLRNKGSPPGISTVQWATQSIFPLSLPLSWVAFNLLLMVFPLVPVISAWYRCSILLLVFLPLCIHEICVAHAEILVASQIKMVFGWLPSSHCYHPSLWRDFQYLEDLCNIWKHRIHIFNSNSYHGSINLHERIFINWHWVCVCKTVLPQKVTYHTLPQWSCQAGHKLH